MHNDIGDDGPSLITLERTLERTPRFLDGINRYDEIAASLATRSYTAADHQEGWRLYHQATSSGQIPAILREPRPLATQAVAALDAWDEEGFRTTQATLRYTHRAQLDFVMSGLTASTGISAVVGVRTYLTRLNALEHSPDRAATREPDHQAIARLTRRGITPEKRAELWAHVAQAETLSAPPAEAQARAAEARQREADRHQALLALYAWFSEWSEMARLTIKKRKHLIALGLANPAARTARTPDPTA